MKIKIKLKKKAFAAKWQVIRYFLVNVLKCRVYVVGCVQRQAQCATGWSSRDGGCSADPAAVAWLTLSSVCAWL
jgi:hypothetical protein